MAQRSEQAGPSSAALASASSVQPACYTLPDYVPPCESDAVPSRHGLHGADDLISLFRLKRLWEISVKPYAGSARGVGKRKRSIGTNGNAPQQQQQQMSNQAEAVEGTEGGPGEGTGGTAADDQAPRAMERTYANYVRELPGKVHPSKRGLAKFSAALASANAAGEPAPPIPAELTGRTTMRDIVFRPETTVQRVGPFDEDALRAAFTVEAGQVPEIDLSLLESDVVERASPSKKKRKRKHQREPTDRSVASDEAASKRSRLSAIVGNRTRS